MKTCTKCGKTKVLEEFRMNGKRRRPECLECGREVWRKWREANPEKNRERLRRFRAANPEKVREYDRKTRKWREANPNKVAEYGRKYRAANREKTNDAARKSKRKFRTENLEKAREYNRNWSRKYRAANPAKIAEYRHARRSKTPYSPELEALMAELRKRPCTYCGSTDKITIDHVVPLARGGKHEVDNLAPACGSCNSSKNDKLLEDWAGPLAMRQAA